MAQILTFLGKGGTGKTTLAIAAAKYFSRQGKRVLLAARGAGPTLGLLLDQTLSADPQEIEPHLKVLQFQAAVLLERSWDDIKKLEAQYLRTPFFKEVYGQELGVLPGMDNALELNAIREYETSGQFDVIIYDGSGDETTLRMLGMPEVLSWYIRRFRKVFADSELGKNLSPFLQPISSAVLNVNITADNFAQPTGQVNNILDQGKAALEDPSRVAAYLVTTEDPLAIAAAQYLWGSAQQAGLIIGGVLVNQGPVSETITASFNPLPASSIPPRSQDWQPLIEALPDFSDVAHIPKPVTVNVAERQVRLFLPGFDKNQVKLTQYGPEVTVEAGDQRRNIFLPPSLKGKQVTGAKFQDGYLIISF